MLVHFTHMVLRHIILEAMERSPLSFALTEAGLIHRWVILYYCDCVMLLNLSKCSRHTQTHAQTHTAHSLITEMSLNYGVSESFSGTPLSYLLLPKYFNPFHATKEIYCSQTLAFCAVNTFTAWWHQIPWSLIFQTSNSDSKSTFTIHYQSLVYTDYEQRIPAIFGRVH